MLFKQELVTVPFNGVGLHKRNDALADVLDLSDLLSKRLSLTSVLEGALDKVMERFSFQAGRLYLLDPGGESLTLCMSRGLDVSGLEKVGINQGFTGKAASNKAFVAQRVTSLEDKERSALLASKGLAVVVCVPLISSGELVGVINLGATQIIHMDQEMIDLLMVMGNIIAVAALSAKRQEELVAQAAELKARKEAVEFFAYTVSHDLKSPATALTGLVNLLEKRAAQLLSGKELEVCHQISTAARHIGTLVTEINAYIKAKESALEMEEAPLGEILNVVHQEFLGRLEERKIRWVQPAELPVVRCDRTAMIRALQNLVDNALKYAGPRLSHLEIVCREEDGGHVLGLKDDGQGFDPGEIDNLFLLFKRSGTSQGTEGTGLGLAIVREVARRHGGKAWAETRPGQGAAFYFSVKS